MRLFLYATVSTMVLLSQHQFVHAQSIEIDSGVEDNISSTPKRKKPRDEAQDIEREAQTNPELDLTKVHDPESPDYGNRNISAKREAEMIVYKCFQEHTLKKNNSKFDFAIKTAEGNNNPGVLPHVLALLEERVYSLRSGKEKLEILKNIHDSRHNLHIDKVPVVEAKVHTPSAINLVAGHPLSRNQQEAKVQSVMDEISKKFPKKMEYYTAFYKAVRKRADQEKNPEIQVMILMRASQMLLLGPMKTPIERGKEAGKLYSLRLSGVLLTPSNQKTTDRIVSQFYGKMGFDGMEDMYNQKLRRVAPKSKQAMSQTWDEIQALKAQSLKHATQTHDTVVEHTDHMAKVIQSMEDHLNQNHGDPDEAVTALAKIKNVHAAISNKLKIRNKDQRLLTSLDARSAIMSLGKIGQDIMDLPDDHGEKGHKNQLMAQHAQLLSALSDHEQVIQNHMGEHATDVSQHIKTMGFERAQKEDSSQDASSHSTGAEADHSSSPPTPEHHSGDVVHHDAPVHESHHDAPVHGATPHEAHVTPEHHSSGH